MKLAVIDHIGNPGGGSRVVRCLLPAMKRARPDLEITFFGNPSSMRREEIDNVAKAHGIRVEPLVSTSLAGKDLFKIRGSRHILKMFQNRIARHFPWLPVRLSGELKRELERKVRGFDAAFFPWPFHLECPALDCPMIGIFHDFNFKYYFSNEVIVPWMIDALNRQMPQLLARFTPIVSTEFMRGELAKFYPSAAAKTEVVQVAPFNDLAPINPAQIQTVMQKFNISGPYLLYPTNIRAHKNIGPLLAALSLLKKKGYPHTLVFAGYGTEVINGKSCPKGIELTREGRDVFGLGYVTNFEIDALTQGATLIVNSSLYEGGNGPGFDAWSRGVPVAMSNIPPFLEHLETYNVRAPVFDPRSPEDIAEKIEAVLSNPRKAQEDAEHSQRAIRAFTWDRVAEQYLQICDKALCNV